MSDEERKKQIAKMFEKNPKLTDLIKNAGTMSFVQPPSIYDSMKKTQQMMDQLQRDRIQRELKDQQDEERRHQELIQAVKEQVKNEIYIENKGNLQQMINSPQSVQSMTTYEDIDYPRLIETLRELFQHLPEEDLEDAKEALQVLQDNANKKEKPNNIVVRYLRKLANGALEKCLATLGAEGIVLAGQWAIHILDNLK